MVEGTVQQQDVIKFRSILYIIFFKHLPFVLICFGLSDPLRLAGLRLEEVFKLFDGLDALPDVEVSVLSVLDEL